MAEIKHMIQIDAPPEQVYPLVATGKGFGQWWAADVTEAAGAVELGFFNRTTLYRLRLNSDQSPSQADWVCETGDEWNGTHITFHVERKGAGTQLRFQHGAWRNASDYFVSCNTTWGELMFRLKAAGEGKTPGPLFTSSGLGY